MSAKKKKTDGVPVWISTMNRLVRAMVRIGLPMGPTILLTVRGRTSGQPRTVPVGLFQRDGQRWLFGQFGDVNWVRNLRAPSEGVITRGRHREAIVATELSQEAAAIVLKDVVAPWVRGPRGAMASVIAGHRIFEVARDEPVSEFMSEVPRHPIFEVHSAVAASTVERPGFRFRLPNPIVKGLLHAGIPIPPMVLLTVRGRKTGQLHTTPVGLFELDGHRYLFSTFGEVNWVRNLRAAGTAIVTHRRRWESFIAVELAPERAGPILQSVLRPYLESPMFGRVLQPHFPVEAGSPVGAFVNEARRHPVFELLERGGSHIF